MRVRGSVHSLSWPQHLGGSTVEDSTKGERVSPETPIGTDRDAELRESRRALQTLVTNLPGIAYRCRNEPGWPMEYMSPACREVTGYEPEELLASPSFTYASLILAEDADGIWQRTQEAVKEGCPFEFEYRIRRRDGEVRWVWERGVCVQAATADSSAFLEGLIIDITQRRKALQALAESEVRMRDFLETVDDIVYFQALDGAVTLLNDANEAITGYSKADFENDPQIWRTILHPEDLQVIDDFFANEAGTAERFETKYRARHRNGQWKWIHCFMVAAHDETGAIVGYNCVDRDITERKRNEELQETVRELARQLSEATELRTLGRIAAAASRKVLAHDFFILNYFSEERQVSIGIYLEDTNEGDDAPHELEPIDVPRDIFENSRSYRGISTLTNRKDEDWKTAGLTWRLVGTERVSRSLMTTPIIWEGRTIGVMSAQSYTPNRYCEADLRLLETIAAQCGGAIRRIRVEEERRALEAQMLQAQKLESLGVLAGGIAHDFNNLLMSVLGYADLTLSELPANSPLCEYLAEIEKGARRGADLCKQMLAYSGKGRFLIETLDLRSIVDDITHLLQISISKKAVLRYRYAENLPPVQADATQLRQIVMNLVINASDALEDRSGVISISTGLMECDHAYLSETYLNDELPEGLYTYLEVADTGCGMDAETRARVFDPFFTTKFAGRGLGLAAVLGIVRSHKGAIKIYSEPGRGTTFKVLFPVVEGSGARRLETPYPVDTWRGTGTILVVDDEVSVRTVTKLYLEKVGFKVLAAEDGVPGVETYRAHRDEIVLVVLDLTMPRMSGEECFRELRRIDKDIPVLLSSGYSESEVLQHFSGKGLSGFIQKPFKRHELVEKVRKALGA
ncbi:MAG: hypothetical protein PWP23_2858 [Candidatus Sumerlaeota bacterium]|nr:hypothetical protein [Candidatus Sumerlaeota bacterium]